jgi:4-hydroxy-2-oxoheptanedioate aldolase
MMREYLQQANGSMVTIVQIETEDALKNVIIFLKQTAKRNGVRASQIEEIEKVPGVEVLDHGNSLGQPLIDDRMHKELNEAAERVK